VHELSLCDDLLSQVVTIAAQNNAQSVESITVQIGELSGIEPVLLESAFDLIKVGSIAEQAKLILQTSAVTVFCRVCGAESEVTVNNLLCQACKGNETKVIKGDELILASVALNCAEQNTAMHS